MISVDEFKGVRSSFLNDDITLLLQDVEGKVPMLTVTGCASISDKEGTLTVSKFIFESNERLDEYSTLELVNICDGVYRYEVPVISIYQSHNLIALPLLNKAATLFNRTSTIVTILKYFKRGLISSLGAEDNTNLEWIGSTRSAPKNGVFFKASNQAVTEEGACRCVEYLVNETSKVV